MGLDTIIDYNCPKEKVVAKLKEWCAKNNFKPTDVDVWTTDKGEELGWISCHSRILAMDISKLQGLDTPFEYMKNMDFNLMQNMNAKETIKIGKRAMNFIDNCLKILPDNHQIVNGYTMDANQKWIPAGYQNTKESLQHAKKQARWFIMVGECGFGTIASY